MRKAATEKNPIRVLIVDDSKVTRAVIGKILQEAAPQVKIVGYAEDGASALKALDVCEPDIIILDLAMPAMDGLTALPLILQKKPQTRIVVCSAASAPGAEISVRALALGATVCVAKPVGSKNPKAIADFNSAIKQAVLGLNEAPVKTAPESPRSLAPDLVAFRPRLIAIGSSTGGPNALISLLKDLGKVPVPIVITQHMMEMFIPILARQIGQETGVECTEAAEGLLLEPGRIYLAAGGSHMALKKSGQRVTIALDDGAPENFCKPAVDVMLRSAVEVYGGDIMTIILTGMGKDGLIGCEAVAKAGGRIIVQDQETSIVWGMPGSVANAGLASAILPVSGLARAVRNTLLDVTPRGVS
ncbi:MAG: Chemotaxis response regulator protein-glutamate methylesterase CheB [Alphaproteobacteria bacterium]|jgi:two-component system chemotaxis response regulator CheB|nr:Chemotaxis response regulator protein-glutamate methylesterase CheB [Alphaproteobacteria bacterium]